MKRIIIYSLAIVLLIYFVILLYPKTETSSPNSKGIKNMTINNLENTQTIPGGGELTDKSNNEGKKIKVALLDSGISKEHPDLLEKIVKEFNSTKLPNVDNLGHGTSIAGILTANDNDFGIVGVSQNIDIYSAKVIHDDGKIIKQEFINGMEWAISNDVDVINLSLGFDKAFPELKDSIAKAIDSGIVVIAASGNNYGQNAQFPARYKEVISVGAIDMNLKPLKVSAIGKVDFVAPGEDIISSDKNGGYSTFNGTSFSTAFVTGIVAEYLSQYNIQKNKETQSVVYEYLKSNSTKLEFSKEIVGNGIPKLNSK